MPSFSNYPPPAAENGLRGDTTAEVGPGALGSNIRIICSGSGDASVEKAIRIPRTSVRLTKITVITESGTARLTTLYSRPGRLVSVAGDASYATHSFTPSGTPDVEVLTAPGVDHEARSPNTGEGSNAQTDAYVWVVVDNGGAWTGTVQFSGYADSAEV